MFDKKEYFYPSVRFKKNSEAAQAAAESAWGNIQEARDSLENYLGRYKALLRDLPDEGEWQEAHDTAKYQQRRIAEVLKELVELDRTFNVMADDIRVLKWSLPNQDAKER